MGQIGQVFGNDVFVNSFQFRGCQVGEQAVLLSGVAMGPRRPPGTSG